MNKLLIELKSFLRKNWWISILLIFVLIIVWFTWNWNIFEITLLFLVNFIWNLLIMVMQSNYTDKNNKIWGIYQLSSTLVFLTIWIYWLIYLWQSQYIIWQIAYWLAAIKAFTYYNYKKDFKILSETTFVFLNIFLFIIFIKYFNYQSYSIFQAIWFSFITTWLVSIKDKLRYWLNIIWIFALTSWSLWWVIISFNSWSLDWIALWFFILTLTVFIYYLKLIKKYI